MIRAPGSTGLAISGFATSMAALTRGTDIALPVVMTFGDIDFALPPLRLGHREGSFGWFTTCVVLALMILLLVLQSLFVFLILPLLTKFAWHKFTFSCVAWFIKAPGK